MAAGQTQQQQERVVVVTVANVSSIAAGDGGGGGGGDGGGDGLIIRSSLGFEVLAGKSWYSAPIINHQHHQHQHQQHQQQQRRGHAAAVATGGDAGGEFEGAVRVHSGGSTNTLTLSLSLANVTEDLGTVTAVRYLWSSAPCSGEVFSCPVYVTVPPLGELTGEHGVMPIGPAMLPVEQQL